MIAWFRGVATRRPLPINHHRFAVKIRPNALSCLTLMPSAYLFHFHSASPVDFRSVFNKSARTISIGMVLVCSTAS